MQSLRAGGLAGPARMALLGSRSRFSTSASLAGTAGTELRALRALRTAPSSPLATRPAARAYSTPTGEPNSNARDSNSNSNSNSNTNTNDNADPGILYKMLEAAATSAASIIMLGVGFGLAGYGYHRFYKHLVLSKMDLAFEPGDPVLELAALGRGVPKHLTGSSVGVMHRDPDDTKNADKNESENDEATGDYWIERPEQNKVNDIIGGREVGHYHLFIGEKGTGKSSMQMEAMALVDAEGVAMFDAHADLEIFRIRLGKALNYEYNEDYIGGYFSERGPRESTALLDIERALNKLEKVALRRRNRVRPGQTHRPLIMVVNQMHLIRDDDDGRDLIELLQQRAEQWAAAGLVTMVFNSDDYWVYERLKQLAARMEVHSIQDLSRRQAMATLQNFRWRYFGEHLSQEQAAEVYSHVGGRLTFLNRVARSRDMLATCRRIMEAEKTWFLNQCWVLGAEMDDDVMDQQKWAAAAMVLAAALVDKEADDDSPDRSRYAERLPSFALHEAQQIMTRADFIREMDRRNLFTISSDAQVRAASVPMQEALRQICNTPGFRQHLDATIERISAIESLGRTRELVAKDLVLGGRYEFLSGTASTAPPPGSVFKGFGHAKDTRDVKATEVRFHGWSPHAQDPPEDADDDKDDKDDKSL